MQKKYLKISFIFLILGLLAGVYYREFSKFHNLVHTYSTLGLVHTHILLLGFVFTIIIGILNDKFNKNNNKLNNISFILYIIGVFAASFMMLIRGTINILIEVNKMNELSSGINSMISGISGLAHILTGISLIFIFITYLKKDNKA